MSNGPETMEADGSPDDDDHSSNADSIGDEVDMIDDEQISVLRKSIAANPFDYQSHVSLIKGLRARGDLDELRQARQAMRLVYPLTPSLWLQWIQDEKSLEDDSDIDLHELFESAVLDYVSVELWLEYAQWGIGRGDVQLTRQIFERALGSCGLHLRKGALLWDCYRLFEMQVLNATSEGDKEAYAEQRNRVDSLYRRQLRLPLEGIDEAHQEYQQFCNGSVDASVTNEFVKATGRLPALQKLEDALDDIVEQKDKDEKALLLAHRDIIRHEVAYAVSTRAVRNVYWAAEVWRRCLLVAEKHGHKLVQLEQLFQKAWLSTAAGDAGDSVDLNLEWIFIQQRHAAETHSNGPISGDSSVQNHAVGSENRSNSFWLGSLEALRTRYGDHGYMWDPNGDFRRAYARFAAERGDFATVDAMFKYFAEVPEGRLAATWIERCQIIVACAPSDSSDRARRHVRQVLTTAINALAHYDDANPTSEVTQSLLLTRFWLQLEREWAVSAPESLYNAEKIIEQTMARVADAREGKQRKRAARKQVDKVDDKDKQRLHQQRRQKKVAERKKETEKVLQDATKPDIKRKRQLSPMVPNTASNTQLATTNGSPPTKQPRPQDTQKLNTGAMSTDDAPCEFKMPLPVSAVKKGSAQSTITDQSASASSHAGQSCSSQSSDPETDRTVFVSNLLYTAPEEVVKQAMSTVGSVQSVDLAKGRTKGQHRGFGYVVFATKKEAMAALSLDRTKVSGRPMFVQKALDKTQRQKIAEKIPRNDTVASRVTAGMEKNKLFVRNLPHNATENEIKELFSHFGQVVGVRVVTQKSGKPKGIAYVDFSTEEAASKAVVAADNTNFKGRPIQVAISNPPAKRPTNQSPSDQQSNQSQSHQKSRISLDLKPSTSSVTGMQPRSVSGKKLSNEQFRKMLLDK